MCVYIYFFPKYTLHVTCIFVLDDQLLLDCVCSLSEVHFSYSKHSLNACSSLCRVAMPWAPSLPLQSMLALCCYCHVGKTLWL